MQHQNIKSFSQILLVYELKYFAWNGISEHWLIYVEGLLGAIMQMSSHNLATSHKMFVGLGFWKCFQGSNSGPLKVLNHILKTLFNASFDLLRPFAVDLEKEFNHS